MKTIVVSPSEDEFGDPLWSVISILKGLNQLKRGEEFCIDFSQLLFHYATLLLPVTAHLSRYKRLGHPYQLRLPADGSYLKTIGFPEGKKPPCPAERDRFVLRYSNKTYLPILRFPVSGVQSSSEIRNRMIGDISTVLRNQTAAPESIVTALDYLMSEAIGNIFDHAKSSEGFVFSQAYPKKGFLDLVIADAGIGIKGSYQQAGFDEVETDVDALQKALRGQSVKQADEGRGYGIRTSRRMIAKGLGGNYILWSGEAAAVPSDDPESPKILELPTGAGFPGTVVAMRILITNKHFNLYNFVE